MILPQGAYNLYWIQCDMMQGELTSGHGKEIPLTTPNEYIASPDPYR